MNLIEGIQNKVNYIRDTIIPEYDAIGPSGMFGKMMLLDDIKRSEEAIASGDIIKMLEVYEELKDTCDRAL